MNHTFANGLCFWKYFVFFVLGCLFGTFFEEILYFFQHQSTSSRAGVIYGPFSPLYGFGVVLLLFFLGKKNRERGILKTFFLASFIGGITEYLVSFIIEFFFSIRFWDYSDLFLNLHGRTTIPYMLAWGVFGTILLKLIFPFCSKWIEKIPPRVGKILCTILFLFLLFDIVLTFSAFYRMKERKEGKAPRTFIGEFYDHTYSDDFMYERFPLLKGKL